MIKKSLAFLAGLVLLLTTSAPLLAAEVTVGGEIRVRGRYREALDFDRDDTSTGADSRARLDERYRIRVGAKIQEGLAAFIELESYGRFGFGAASPQATTLSGAGSEGAGVPGARFAWFDARLPGTPITFRLGRQPLTVGHGLVYDTIVYGGDAIAARGPIAGWNWEIAWVKERESDVIAAALGFPPGITQPGATSPGIDNDAESFVFRIKGSPARNHSVEGYVVWRLDNGALVPPGALGPTAGVPFGALSGGGENEVTFGLAWDARLGPVVPRFEVAYQAGDAYGVTGARADNKVSRSAFLVYGGLDYNLTPQWRFSLDAGLGSGNGKNPSDADFNDDKSFFAPNFLTFFPTVMLDDLSNNGFFIFGDRSPVPNPGLPAGTPGCTATTCQTSRTFLYNGPLNIGFVNLAVAYTPVPAWTFQAEAAKAFAHRTFDGMGGIFTGGRPSKDLGFAFGGRVTYRPYRNLTTVWWLGGWIPGDYFDAGLPTAIRKADTGWLARWHALVSF